PDPGRCAPGTAASDSDVVPVVGRLRAVAVEDDVEARRVLFADRSAGASAFRCGDLTARRGQERECGREEESGKPHLLEHGSLLCEDGGSPWVAPPGPPGDARRFAALRGLLHVRLGLKWGAPRAVAPRFHDPHL